MISMVALNKKTNSQLNWKLTSVLISGNISFLGHFVKVKMVILKYQANDMKFCIQVIVLMVRPPSDNTQLLKEIVPVL
jgi:hypothetical protein